MRNRGFKSESLKIFDCSRCHPRLHGQNVLRRKIVEKYFISKFSRNLRTVNVHSNFEHKLGTRPENLQKKIRVTYFKNLTNTVIYFFLLRQVEVVGSQKSVVIYKNKKFSKAMGFINSF